MLSKEQFNKISKALDNGTLKLRILSDEEYRKIEKEFDDRKRASSSRN